MLSLFPSLLTFEALAPFLLRLVLGLVFIFWSYSKTKQNGIKLIPILEGIVGALLIVGFLTQLAAFVGLMILVVRIADKIKSRAFLTNGVNYYLILAVIALSLIFTGAGFMALDLPL